MNYNILIAEDEKDIIDLLKLYLEKENLNILEAYDGKAALEIVENKEIHLAVLDIMMPKLNGFEITKRIREKHKIPIIILSAKQMDSDKILGLDLGADDYIVKPFNPLEVLARIKSQLRRAYDLTILQNSEPAPAILKLGELELDQAYFKLKKNQKEIALTATEFKLLNYLMQSPGRVFTKSQILSFIKGDYISSDDNSLMVYISKLREKIEDNPKKPIYIKTVRGLGYKVEKETKLKN